MHRAALEAVLQSNPMVDRQARQLGDTTNEGTYRRRHFHQQLRTSLRSRNEIGHTTSQSTEEGAEEEGKRRSFGRVQEANMSGIINCYPVRAGAGATDVQLAPSGGCRLQRVDQYPQPSYQPKLRIRLFCGQKERQESQCRVNQGHDRLCSFCCLSPLETCSND